MRADVQMAAIEGRAQAFASQFQMDVGAARQLTQLADRMQSLTAQGQMTDEDRDALSQAALGVAGISGDDVAKAYARMLNSNDQSAVDDLMTKAATNLGMPSTAGLRDQILPSLGIKLQ